MTPKQRRIDVDAMSGRHIDVDMTLFEVVSLLGWLYGGEKYRDLMTILI